MAQEFIGEIEVDDYADWLDEQEFYEICQQYRHARDGVERHPGLLTAAEAFEVLKAYIRERME